MISSSSGWWRREVDGAVVTGVFEPGAVADVGAFLSRLVRLDPGALVRLRQVGAGAGAGAGAVALWARLPFEVLVTRGVRAAADQGAHQDATVRARELLDALVAGSASLPRRYDAQWRWPLPPPRSDVAERLPVAEVRRVGAAAGRALREAVASGVRGRPVGERMLRDALLDHVPIIVNTESDGTRIEVPQRLVQAVVRMGFLGGGEDSQVEVRVAGAWVGLAGEYGMAWRRQPDILAVGIRPAKR